MEEKAQIENNSYSSASAEKRSDGNAVVDDEISLKELILKIRDWWRYLLSKRVVILIVGIIGGLIGLAYASFKKPVYTATTTFVLESGDAGGGGLGQYAGIASMVGIDIGGGGGGIFQGDNIIELYKSRTMIEKTLLSKVIVNGKEELLLDRYIQFMGLREKWAKNPEVADLQFDTKPENFNRTQDSIMGEVVKDIKKKNLLVSKPDKKLSIIKVDVTSKDEFFAKTFNDQIVKNVNDFYVQTKTKKSLENVIILQQKTDSVRAVMNGAIYSTAAVADATPNLNLTRQVQRAAPMQRSQFNAETNKSILSELVKNLEMSKIALRKETPLIQVVDTPIFPLEKDRFGKGKGIVLGIFLFGTFTIISLLISRAFKAALKE